MANTYQKQLQRLSMRECSNLLKGTYNDDKMYKRKGNSIAVEALMSGVEIEDKNLFLNAPNVIRECLKEGLFEDIH